MELYPQNTENQVKYLREVIAGQPVAILLPGPSIQGLEERILELKGLNIKYATCNDFWVMEQRILSYIDWHLDIVMCSAKECGVPSPGHLDYLMRNEKNLFVTEKAGYYEEHLAFDDFVGLFGSKLFFFVADRTPNAIMKPNKDFPLHFPAQASLSILLALCHIGQASI